ncbi:MAG: hypothetical protein FWF51_12295 [Chitinivibrionia bacterium]|jgi:hypothetical protein|nr:hypothetical protein [Chitinivibrionia bacterium]
MAKPIKDTPVLTGNDAIIFDRIIANPKPVSQERRDRIHNAAELMNQAKNGYVQYKKWW